jgi:peptidyl-prolyl cis-trans isomerase SurA
MKTIRAFFFFILAVLSFLLPLPLHAEIVERIVAIVNDEFITLKDVEKYVRVEKGGRFLSVNEYFRNMQLETKIDTFVDDLLIRQQAKKLKIEVSDKEVEGIVANIRKQYLITEEELQQQLNKEGMSYRDFFEGIRMNVLKGRVLNHVISPDVLVTDTVLKEFYNKHIDEYRDEEYKLQQVFISGKREDAQRRALEAFGRLESGEAFEVVAEKFSDDPSAASGGDIGYVKREELIPELRQAVSLLTPGTHTPVLKTPYGLHILRLNEVKKGNTVAFEAVKDRIHARIVQEESDRRYMEYIDKLRRSSYIEIKI